MSYKNKFLITTALFFVGGAIAQAQISPAKITLGPSQKQQFSVSGLTQLTWSIVPNGTGTITKSGLYTAPSSFSAKYVYIYARNGSMYYDTMVQLSPSLVSQTVTSAPAVSISISPSSIYLYGGQSHQFTALVGGTANQSVSWSIVQGLGSVVDGLYSAPAQVSADSLVTISATSAADPTKSASATIQLGPIDTATKPSAPTNPVSVSLSPRHNSLRAGQSKRLTATVRGASNSSLNWWLNPNIGSITNGTYTAPLSIATAQTVTVYAASTVNADQVASAHISLAPSTASVTSVSPSTAAVGGGGSVQFSVQGAASGTRANWSSTPAVGSITFRGLYRAPATVTTQQLITITASDSSTGAVLGTATVALTPPGSTTAPTPTPTPTPAPPTSNSTSATTSGGTITLPIEVMGAGGTTSAVSFSIPQGSNVTQPLQLYAQIHGLKYDTEASVQINNSAWMPISTGNVTLLGLAGAYGGIGGGFHTLELTMDVPSGVVVAGTNTITFRFNQTDGVTSGYRVLAFNIQPAGGAGLIPSSTFVEDDPDTWQPPSTAASDIAAGQALWHSAALTAPGVGAIRAHCADCHSEDGRDLKYFNYSNNSIIVRSEFHGLSAAQGAQIASYIRSLNVPNPGRPWNPPYQPGPGLDSQPAANWSAGAGLDAVLDSDNDMQQYLLPGGSNAGWAATGYVNPRELPIPLQLPDWNSWLPQVHPMDAFGSLFTNDNSYKSYLQLHAQLQPNSASSFQNAYVSAYSAWIVATEYFPAGPANGIWTAAERQNVYSFALWRLTKMWELNQEFGLEAMPQAIFGAKANPRGWVGNLPFGTSPIMLHIPDGPGLSNGTAVGREYLGYVWYHLQLVLNDGQGQQTGQSPIDYSYVQGALKDLSMNSGDTPAAFLSTLWLIKSLQEFTLTGTGPQVAGGLAPTAMVPGALADWSTNNEWNATSATSRAVVITDYLQPWFTQMKTFTVAQYDKGVDGNNRPWASPTENPATDSVVTFGGQVWRMLPRLRYLGVDPNLTYQISAWAATLWPSGNWTLNNSATCISLATCTSD